MRRSIPELVLVFRVAEVAQLQVRSRARRSRMQQDVVKLQTEQPE